MGLAATQIRLLSLTARKANVEFQGQQINQQRMVLSNKSSNVFSTMMLLSVPTPPSTTEFTKAQYNFILGGNTYTTVDGVEPNKSHSAKNEKGEIESGFYISNEGGAITISKNGETASKITMVEVVDYDAYDNAYNQYQYEQYLYEKEMQDINAKTEVLQQQDKALQLELDQLDTERSAITTELEALDKVLDEAVEGGYKTFGG